MAQMLIENSSSEKHLENTERHTRICNRIAAAAFLVTDIQLAIDTLRTATAATAVKEKELTYAYDNIIYLDGLLDNEVYNVFEACKKYDRESGSAPILNSIFITGKLSDIKDAAVMEEPKHVRELMQRLRALGTTHPLYEFVAKLDTKAAESEKAIEAYDAIAKEIALLKVQEEIAQRKLREQYRLNYLHAEEKLGKKTAELLFPIIRKVTKPVDAIVETVEPAKAS